MKKITAIILFSTLAIMTFAQDKLVIDKVIAKVGGETILLSDVESQYAFAQAQAPSTEDSGFIKCQILEALIGQKMIIHQARLDSIIVAEDEVEAQLDFRISNVLRQMNGDEAFFEEYYGMTVDDMRDNLREELEQQLLAEKMQMELINDVNITPREVVEFYNSIPQDSLPYLNAEVEIGEIVAKPEVNEIERLKALQKILEIRKDIIDEKETFAELAQKYSDDPGSGAQGGELGFASRGTYVPEFEGAAYNLEQDEISEPVETKFGFHIIQMQERRGNKLKLRHILIKPNITFEDMEKAEAKLDSVKVLIDNDEIEWSKAVEKFSLEDAQSYNLGGRLQNPNTGKTFFQTSELPPEIYFAIEEMEVGDLSDPLEYTSPTGETEYRIIQLQARTKPHQVSLEQDYSKIQELAKESKKNMYFLQWVNEKLGETYINIDSSYLSCPNLEDVGS